MIATLITRPLHRLAAGLVTICTLLLSSQNLTAQPIEAPAVVVYGATPAGIAAATSAAKSGQTVLLIEPTERIGGLVTSGLSHTDFHSFASLSGAFADFASRVKAHYIKTYGADSAQVVASFEGTFGEPKVNLAIFHEMLAEYPTIRLLKGHRILSVVTQPIANAKSSQQTSLIITSIQLADHSGLRPSGTNQTIKGSIFIDASYEGDLMAAAGVPYRVGREAQAEYDESLAPEVADQQLQAYNFRFIMTDDPNNRVTPEPPPGYRREDFVGVLPVLANNQIKKVFAYPSGCIFKAQTPALPNQKYDINDVSRGLIRLSLPGKNLDWPAGNVAQREAVFAEHVRDQVGLLYFLQNDPEVPEKFRTEAQRWGWCRDEFTETKHLPPQLYVREARRMVGVHVYRQADSEYAPEDARAVLHRDAIAMSDYGNNCHGTAHEGPRFGGKHTGELYNPVAPYQIPYGVLLPRDVSNLLVPGAASSTHVGFCALRLEPTWMSLGQAAGIAAAMAIETEQPVQHVNVASLQARLHQERSATIYVADISLASPDFAAVQWWGTLGGLHGLEPKPAKAGQRGKSLHGQYYEATPGHDAKLDVSLDPAVESRWHQLAVANSIPEESLPKAGQCKTRGEWLRFVFTVKPQR